MYIKLCSQNRIVDKPVNGYGETEVPTGEVYIGFPILKPRGKEISCTSTSPIRGTAEVQFNVFLYNTICLIKDSSIVEKRLLQLWAQTKRSLFFLSPFFSVCFWGMGNGQSSWHGFNSQPLATQRIVPAHHSIRGMIPGSGLFWLIHETGKIYRRSG